MHRKHRSRAGTLRVGILLPALAIPGSVACFAQSPPNPIQHVIIIMQENRSFDEYFGTFPGADGFPRHTCVPLLPKTTAPCLVPFHNPLDANAGASHDSSSARVDIDDGKTSFLMDGFVAQQAILNLKCNPPDSHSCVFIETGISLHDTVGYHDDREIPNYWRYAKQFVLQDRLFEGVRAWSYPAHLDLVSEWAASCTDDTKASTCTTTVLPPKPSPTVSLPWVNLFQLLDAHGVSWKYYVDEGTEPDCVDGQMTCEPMDQASSVASAWNPAPLFASVWTNGAGYIAEHNPNAHQFLIDLQQGTLPQVSWVVPSFPNSEHSPASVTRGMEYVTSMVNAVMQSPYWTSTVIFIAWDDWGGFYDHVVPPVVDWNATHNAVEGYGLRVPGLMISAYARAGMIDHHVLSFDSYATFIENLFMGGARLDPVALGNPDSRPTIRDAMTSVVFPDGHREPLGDLRDEFDFTQPPLPPLLLSAQIPGGIRAQCGQIYAGPCASSVVEISWSPVTGVNVAGPLIYHVTRDGKRLPQCAGLANRCADTPGSGVHLYRVYSVDAHGVRSPLSAAARAVEP